MLAAASTMTRTVRRTFTPADVVAIGALHERVYTPEFGIDGAAQAADVTAAARDELAAGFPGRPADAVWLVDGDRAGVLLGCAATCQDGPGAVRLRWVVLDPVLRGSGLGGRLLAEAVAHARSTDASRMWFTTFSDLTTAARRYRDLGFAVEHAETRRQWGRELTLQTYAMAL